MRSGVVVVASVGALLLLTACGSSVHAVPAASKNARLRLAPNAMAFMDSSHGVLGTGWAYGTGSGGGSIALTSDGGRTWHTVELTPRPVVSLTAVGNDYIARYDDGETLASRDGHVWSPTPVLASNGSGFSTCPQGMEIGTNSGVDEWSLCTTQPAAGNQGKAVYRNLPARGWVRVACTNFANAPTPCSGGEQGGIGGYGYAIGIAGGWDGFGLIWESRGTLYVSRDGGRQWTGLDKLIQPEIDFVGWAFVLPRGGVGWTLVTQGGHGPFRLLRTTDAGKTWTVVHRWAATAKR